MASTPAARNVFTNHYFLPQFGMADARVELDLEANVAAIISGAGNKTGRRLNYLCREGRGLTLRRQFVRGFLPKRGSSARRTIPGEALICPKNFRFKFVEVDQFAGLARRALKQ